MKMTRETAIGYIKDNIEDYLKSRGIDTRKKFRCLNPMHNDTNPSMNYWPSDKRVHCFSCSTSYDAFDLIGIEYGLTEFNEVLHKGCELYNIEIVSEEEARTSAEASAPRVPISDIVVKYNFTEMVYKAHDVLMNNEEAIKHFTDRGIGKEILHEYKIGYWPNGYEDLKDHTEIIPISYNKENYKYVLPYWNAMDKCAYFQTEAFDRTKLNKNSMKYLKLKGIPAPVFNERYLYNESLDVIFICEGIYDALSIEEVGGKAIALTGTGTSRITEIAKETKTSAKFVIIPDNDTAGRTAAEKLKAELEDADRICDIVLLAEVEEKGDANDLIIKDRVALTRIVQNSIEEVKKRKLTAKQEEAEKAFRESRKKYVIGNAMKYKLTHFLEEVKASANAKCSSTGFEDIDKLLDGGLYAGLYIIGAISSLGKTSFCLQVMDNIAKSGRDIYIFSLEMATRELIAKSLSRITYLKDIEQNRTTRNAKTTRGILTGSLYNGYSAKEIDLIIQAMGEYSEYADHIYIQEGIGNITVDSIRRTVEDHKEKTGNAPVVLIDYIQILAPTDTRLTDKQNTDKAVLELKRLSRDLEIPVVGISSFNRDNYTAPVNMASFKESGAIEFSSDVLIGLQYEGMEYSDDEGDTKRTKRIRKLIEDQIKQGKEGKAQNIHVKILKNRNGVKGSAYLNFYPKFNYFEDKALDEWTTVNNAPEF